MSVYIKRSVEIFNDLKIQSELRIKLLQKHFGAEWRKDQRLQFFIHVLGDTPLPQHANEETEASELDVDDPDETAIQFCEEIQESAELTKPVTWITSMALSERSVKIWRRL